MVSIFNKEKRPSFIMERKQYIEKLKQLILNDEKMNEINLEVAAENFFEFKHKINYNNNKNTYNYFFTLGGHNWCLSFISNDRIFLKNYDVNNEKPVLAKFVVSFREYNNLSDFKPLNVSSLYWFNNKGYKNGYYLNKNSDGYMQEINNMIDLKFNKPLAKNNKIMIGIYLRIYEKDEIEIYKDYLRKDSFRNPFKKCDIKGILYERVEEDWMSHDNYCSNIFEYGGYKWILKLRKINSRYSFCLTLDRKSLKSYSKSVCCSIIFYIRNDNDFSCINVYPYGNICRFDIDNNKICYNNCFDEIDLLLNNDDDKSILDDNRLVYGVFLKL